MEKVRVFWKIQHKCCRIGSKMFKINVEIVERKKLKWPTPL